jgi:predicted TIM-barrel fold metal-dependent hydrolase
MIIDGDTHISPGARGFYYETNLEAMEKAGVDKALVWLSPHHYRGEELAEHNAYVSRAAREHPDRFLPIGWADPTISVEHAREMVRRSVEEWGFHGVKLNGAQNNYFIDDPELALPVAEEIAKAGKMIAFHIGPDAYERTHPFRAARVARRFPEIPILMVHMGMTSRDMNRAVIEMACECPNMMLVASATTDALALEAVRALGASRVCFGSDRPFRKMHVVRAMFEAAFADELETEEMKLFMGGNMARLFGIA